MSEVSLSEAVHQLMHAYKQVLREAIRQQQITLPITQIRTLKGICRNPQSTAQSIAQRMQRDKAQITRVLNDLINAGLVVKVANPGDGRSHLLQPTAAGKKIMSRLDVAEDKAAQRLTGDLTAEEVAVFLRLSKTMVSNVERVTDTEES